VSGLPAPALRALIERYRTELACADMIDDAGRRRREMARWSERIAELERQLAAAEGDDPTNPTGSGPEPIEERES
jgi:hypothetical protein